jgi:hypothetical protein
VYAPSIGFHLTSPPETALLKLAVAIEGHSISRVGVGERSPGRDSAGDMASGLHGKTHWQAPVARPGMTTQTNSSEFCFIFYRAVIIMVRQAFTIADFSLGIHPSQLPAQRSRSIM